LQPVVCCSIPFRLCVAVLALGLSTSPVGRILPLVDLPAMNEFITGAGIRQDEPFRLPTDQNTLPAILRSRSVRDIAVIFLPVSLFLRELLLFCLPADKGNRLVGVTRIRNLLSFCFLPVRRPFSGRFPANLYPLCPKTGGPVVLPAGEPAFQSTFLPEGIKAAFYPGKPF
jgi:hypothetical protein